VRELAEWPVLQESHLEKIIRMRRNEQSFVGGQREHPDVHGFAAAQAEEAEDEPEDQ
jgi:hypothetical protein